LQNANWVSKNAELDADFESVEKVAKNSCKKVINEKVTEKSSFYFYYCLEKFSAYIFFGELYCTFFNRLELSIKFCD
jgi:hypothetical protein